MRSERTMTKKEALRQTHQENTLLELGFTRAEAEALRRISLQLHRWHELECGVDGGGVERDETTGKVTWYNAMTGRRSPYPDRETGAKKRLAAILDRCNQARRDGTAQINTDARDPREPLAAYIQTDPRGAALYIIRPGDVPAGASVESYYTRGVCIY